MKPLKIYIASSWKNKHGVEMLTALLREAGHEVISWVENCSIEGTKSFDFEDWVNTKNAEDCFHFDIVGATRSDLLIYYGPAGKDACCELGAAYASGVKILGLYAKGEELGLMRKMVLRWYICIPDLMIAVDMIANAQKYVLSDEQPVEAI